MLAESWLPAPAEEVEDGGKPAPAFNPAAPEYNVSAITVCMRNTMLLRIIVHRSSSHSVGLARWQAHGNCWAHAT